MMLGRKPVGVGKVGVCSTEFGCTGIHPVDKVLDITGYSRSNNIAGFIGGFYQRTIKIISEGHLFSRGNLGIAAVGIHTGPAVRRGCDHSVHADVSTLHRFHGEQTCHNLGQACRRAS